MKARDLLSSLLLVPVAAWLALVLIQVVPVETNYYLRKSGINFQAASRPQWLLKEGPRLEIPSIFLDEKIIFDVDSSDERVYQKALAEGVAQAAGTGLPGSGKLGYYFAHSSEPAFLAGRKPPFLLLDRLKAGDLVYIVYEKRRFSYVVTSLVVVEPTDLSFLDEAYDRETIVLQGCWPPLTDWKRLLVFAKRLPGETLPELSAAFAR